MIKYFGEYIKTHLPDERADPWKKAGEHDAHKENYRVDRHHFGVREIPQPVVLEDGVEIGKNVVSQHKRYQREYCEQLEQEQNPRYDGQSVAFGKIVQDILER